MNDLVAPQGLQLLPRHFKVRGNTDGTDCGCVAENLDSKGSEKNLCQAASGQTGGTPAGRPISPSDGWQTLTFDPTIDPITAFPGSGAYANGVINGTRGTLEHLAVTVNAGSPDRSSGAYVIYVDNVYNLNADGGPDFLITDFESFAPGVEALFQEPNFSGSTDFNLVLTAPPISDAST